MRLFPFCIAGVICILALLSSVDIVSGNADFTVAANSYWSGPGQFDYYIEGIVEGEYIKWSWSSDQRLDFQLANPRGEYIESLKSQTLTSGSFKAQDTGTYHLYFQNYNEVEAHVSANVERDLESELFNWALVGILLLIIVIVVVIGLVVLFSSKKKKTPSTAFHHQPQQQVPQPQYQQPPAQVPVTYTTPPPQAYHQPSPQPPPIQQPLTPATPIQMSTCPTCGYQNFSDARFCNSCGKPVQSQ